MKFLNVILISFIVSIIITMTLSIINYTPVAQREPNTYYFSIMESFIFMSMFMIPFCLVAGIFSFFAYLIIERKKQLSTFPQKVLSVLIGLGITSAAFYMYVSLSNTETNDIYLIPEGYEGEVYAFYNVRGAPKVEKEGKYSVHPINEEGYFVTSTHDLDYGTVTDRYYYVDDHGNRTPIDHTCVNLFGTGGLSDHGEDNVTSISYTGFELTKDHCGEEFMLRGTGRDHHSTLERVSGMIFKEYYNIEFWY
ncbi:hypothetical protein N0O92_23265 [Alkalihalobacillus sp. MEB130]|uniref:DUF6843 domain-containing protein n=1 Tax=Alkalihalobacillus sp. MEB130 TaxID=2976704 RepID=UPI0028DEABA0|nr:hypothetical protein [Alkalihalobacillus sp. MEB130]MDT8863076.1 hypothetical protein [Alkalihalobacillus sp. MEB130]